MHVPGLEDHRPGNAADYKAAAARAWHYNSPEEDVRHKGPKCYQMKGVNGETYSGTVFFDVDPSSLRKTHLLCLKIWRGRSAWPVAGMGMGTENGLAILSTKDAHGNEAYQRVGMFHLKLPSNQRWPHKASIRTVRMI
jgi:hypothetical protein